MKATELMIGDLVYYSRPEDGIAPYKEVICIEAEDLCRDACIIETHYEPIPLTPEILEKNGWTKRRGYPTEYEFIDGECVHIYYDTKHCHLMIDLYGDNIINIVENRVHKLQHALRLCGLDALADNFRV